MDFASEDSILRYGGYPLLVHPSTTQAVLRITSICSPKCEFQDCPSRTLSFSRAVIGQSSTCHVQAPLLTCGHSLAPMKSIILHHRATPAILLLIRQGPPDSITYIYSTAQQTDADHNATSYRHRPALRKQNSLLNRPTRHHLASTYRFACSIHRKEELS